LFAKLPIITSTETFPDDKYSFSFPIRTLSCSVNNVGMITLSATAGVGSFGINTLSTTWAVTGATTGVLGSDTIVSAKILFLACCFA